MADINDGLYEHEKSDKPLLFCRRNFPSLLIVTLSIDNVKNAKTIIADISDTLTRKFQFRLRRGDRIRRQGIDAVYPHDN